MRELGIISELQAAKIAFSTKNLTLGFDATTQEGVHVNVVHLKTESSCMVVAIDQLAGGTAYDYYMTHITKSVDNLAKYRYFLLAEEIAWSISSAGKKRLANIQCHEEMKAELIKRMAKKNQNKEEKERRKVEKIF